MARKMAGDAGLASKGDENDQAHNAGERGGARPDAQRHAHPRADQRGPDHLQRAAAERHRPDLTQPLQ